ncbi:MAG: rhomboid family intramembrane serine protease [Planctomycetota bacterium]
MEPTPPSPEGQAPPPGEQPNQPQSMQLPEGLEQPSFVQRLWQIKAALLLFAAMLVNFHAIYKEVGRLLIPVTTRNVDILIKHGLFSDVRVHEHGEWWRHFTALVTPTGVIDLVICAWIFWSLGPMLERLLGTIRFLALFLLAGAGGIALAEVLAPESMRWSGPWVGLYATFGALPGIVFADTFSLGKTLRHPGTRSCAFWVVLGLVFAYLSETELKGQSMLYDWRAQLGGMGLGLVLGFALTALTSRPALGIPASLLTVGAAVGLIVASSQGATLDLSTHTVDGPTRERDPDEQHIDTAEDALSAEEQLIEDAETFLTERWGPLPVPVLRPPSDQEVEQAQTYYEQLEKLALGTNEVTDEVDPLRIKLLVVLARYSKATQIAEEYVQLQSRSPQSEALAGMAFAIEGGSKLHDAASYLQSAMDDSGLATTWPEAVFLYALALDGLHEDVSARANFQRYLTIATQDGRTDLPYRLPLVDYAEQKLRR